MGLIDVCVCLCVSPQAFMLPLPSCCERNRSPPHRLGSAGSAVALTSRSTSEVMWSTRLLFLCSLFAPLAVGKIQRAGVDVNKHARKRPHTLKHTYTYTHTHAQTHTLTQTHRGKLKQTHQYGLPDVEILMTSDFVSLTSPCLGVLILEKHVS